MSTTSASASRPFRVGVAGEDGFFAGRFRAADFLGFALALAFAFFFVGGASVPLWHAAAWAVGTPWDAIQKGLSSFISDLHGVPGRFNVFDHAGATVIADYGHNPDAIAALVAGVQNMPAQRRSVVISGAGLGLPGVDPMFDDANIARILAGEQFIGSLSESARARMVDMRITRLVKSEAGGASFQTIDDPAEVIKLAGRRAPLDVVEQFAVDTARDEALDSTTRLAIGAGFDALRDAGIPLCLL